MHFFQALLYRVNKGRVEKYKRFFDVNVQVPSPVCKRSNMSTFLQKTITYNVAFEIYLNFTGSGGEGKKTRLSLLLSRRIPAYGFF